LVINSTRCSGPLSKFILNGTKDFAIGKNVNGMEKNVAAPCITPMENTKDMDAL